MRRLTLTLLLCLAALSACGAEGQRPNNPPQLMTIAIQASLVDEVILTGGALQIELRRVGALIPAQARVLFKGQLGGSALDATLSAELIEQDGSLLLEIPWERLSAALGAAPGLTFDGTLQVQVDDLGGALTGEAALEGARLAFLDTLDPALEPPASAEVFLNQRVLLPARGVLRNGEGRTEVLAAGTFTPEGGAAVEVSLTLPVEIGADRAEGALLWSAAALGIRPGVFVGALTPQNTHAGGAVTQGEPREVEVRVLRTEIDGFDPPAASRGQITRVIGRGLIPADANAGQSMFFLLDGTFRDRNGEVLDLSGERAIQIAPEGVPDHTEARVVLRSQLEARDGLRALTGLTAVPGDFQGTVTPVLVDGVDTVRGRSFQGSLTIAPTRQEVFVKFLPSFGEALERYGLRNVEPELRDRVLAVLRRDYADFNLGFSDERPADFVEYSIIEVGGPDPNGAGLFGLDNSAGKDTGNLRLDDIVGGQNAESGEQGFYVFGGVFIDSFVIFSPSLSNGAAVASSRFDDIFSATMPALGGAPVDASEWPNGPRAAQIQEALTVMGNLIGGTLTHEIGHSLGLAWFESDDFGDSTQFHNTFDEPGSIMDSGQFRPFEERAEIDGADPPRFNARNRDYLRRVLPLP
jgi:hypothetical protein